MLASVSFDAGSGELVVIGDNLVDDNIKLIGNENYQQFTVEINGDSSPDSPFYYSDVISVKVYGRTGNDTITNTLLIDTEIFGEGGDDYLEGGWANDRVIGGNGIDILVGKNGDDVLNGQGGNDWIFGGVGNDALSGLTGHDILYGGDGNDTMNGHGGEDTLYGQAGDDVLYGGVGDDLLLGQGGNDTFRGEAGNDRLVGGEGDDAIYGDAGVDELLGQAGNDILVGGADGDFLWGSDGDDTLRGNEGSDRLNGGAGNDLVFGDEGRDIIRGDGGDDTLRGGDGDDDLYGLGGIDSLFGDAGDDLLDAGGDTAADVLTGGIGLDRFVVLGTIGSSSVDVITDLEAFETINGNDGGVVPTTPSGTASIGDLVFGDADGDGIFDAGEVGIEGVVVTLLSGGSLIATETTDSNGGYIFDGLSAGDYTVELSSDLQFDYDITTASSINVTLADGQVNNAVDFGAQPLPLGTASIGDLVFEDTDGNGQLDEGEIGAPGETLRLTRAGVEISTTTGDSGEYQFTQLRAGDYSVELISGEGREITTTSVVSLSLADGEHLADVDFGIRDVPQTDGELISELLSPLAAGISGFIPRSAFDAIVADFQVNNLQLINSNLPVEQFGDFLVVDDGIRKTGFEIRQGFGGVELVHLIGDFPSRLPSESVVTIADMQLPLTTVHLVPFKELGYDTPGSVVDAAVLLGPNGTPSVVGFSARPEESGKHQVFSDPTLAPLVSLGLESALGIATSLYRGGSVFGGLNLTGGISGLAAPFLFSFLQNAGADKFSELRVSADKLDDVIAKIVARDGATGIFDVPFNLLTDGAALLAGSLSLSDLFDRANPNIAFFGSMPLGSLNAVSINQLKSEFDAAVNSIPDGQQRRYAITKLKDLYKRSVLGQQILKNPTKPFSKMGMDLFENFIAEAGEYELDLKEVTELVATPVGPDQTSLNLFSSANPEGVQQIMNATFTLPQDGVPVQVSGSTLWDSGAAGFGGLGNYTVYYDGVFTLGNNNDVVFNGTINMVDTYDFDPRYGSNSDLGRERFTRIGYIANGLGQDFNVRSVPVSVSQSFGIDLMDTNGAVVTGESDTPVAAVPEPPVLPRTAYPAVRRMTTPAAFMGFGPTN